MAWSFAIDISELKHAEPEIERSLALEHEASARAERAIHERDAVLAIVGTICASRSRVLR
ncbi:MAG TPA: hypothetical protein VNP04_11070 [Alphaproteobacteria bacterium]|nr:hypothetical protein [Alphaproteobacteria bacterium]